MRQLKLLLGASCLVLAISSEANAQAGSGNVPLSNPDAGSSPNVSEVIVTASRRSESIIKVPTAVSAFSGAKLRDQQIISLNDLAAITPNIQINSYLTNANINIRGIGNGNFIQAGGDPGVAVHEDGVYLGQAALALSTFLDVQRVEVLRGPQGTLFGRNATGGAVNIIPNEPTRDLSYGVDVTAGVDPSTVRSDAYVSGALDKDQVWLGRLSVEQDYNEGFSKNGVATGPSRLDGIDDGAIRGQLEWRPTQDFQARLLVEYDKEKDNGTALYLLGNPSGTPVTFPATPPITLPPGFPMGDPQTRTAYSNEGERDLVAKRVDLTTDWAIGGGHLKGILSYGDTHNFIAQDGDGTPIDYTSSDFTNSAKQEYGELLYASDPTKVFDYVVGANYYQENLEQNVFVHALGQSPTFNDGGKVDTTSYAAFAHGEYKIIDRLKLFAGVRWTHDKKTDFEFNNFAGTAAGQDSWSHATYEVGMSYDITRQVTGYAKYSTGYKSGGYSVGSLQPAFNPETDASYEAGLKGVYFGGALQANLAAFHMDYDNLQITQVIGASSVVTNAARATIDGVEVESVIRPAPHLRIEASGGYLKARFDQFLTADSARPALGILNLAGNTLPGAPSFNTSVGAYYDIPIEPGTITLGSRYDWKDKIYFSEFNTPISAQSSAGKLDLFLNFKSLNQRWTASLFATNLTDEEVKANVVVVSAFLGSLALAQYQPGRQVGASIGYHF